MAASQNKYSTTSRPRAPYPGTRTTELQISKATWLLNEVEAQQLDNMRRCLMP